MTKNHPALEALADHVRGVADDDDRAEVAAHLDACRRCRTAAAALGTVATAGARTEAAPAGARRILEAFFQVETAARPARTLTLAFDSRSAPRLAGTRNLDSAQRQLRFEGPGVDLDLRLDLERDRDEVGLVGQLLERRPPRPLADLPMLVWQDDRLIGRAVTDRFGQFQMSVRPSGPLRLTGTLADGQTFEAAFDRRREGSARPTLPVLGRLPRALTSADDDSE